MEKSLVLIEKLEQENRDYMEERKSLQRKKRIQNRRRKKIKRKAIFCLIICILFSISISFIMISVTAMAKESYKPVVVVSEPMTLNYPEVKEEVIEEVAEEIVIEDIVEEQISNIYAYEVTEEEILMFKQIVSAETYDFWSYNDCLSIATVVINRYNSVGKGFESDWISIFTQDKQFQVYSNGRYLEVPIHESAEKAVEAALMGETNLNSDVLYFCTEEYYNSCPDDDFFKGLEHVYTVRNVFFFTE